MPIVTDFEQQLSKRSPATFGRWWPVDLHNHSPTSRDYRGNNDNAVELTAQKISASPLSIVMFTDHERLPEESFVSELSKRTRRLILRGVELNIFVDAWLKPEAKVDKNLYFHLLIGFDPQQDPEYVLKYIYQECRTEERELGSQKVIGICDIEKLFQLSKKFNAILIPAHLHSTRDAFKSRSIDDIYTDVEFIRACSQFTAIEVTSEGTAAYFDGAHAETANLTKTCIWSSDSHQPDEIARRYCYVQMQEPTFAELKAALELPDRTSLQQPSQASSYIIGLHVKGLFLRDFWLSLSPHCNAFIGVKGAGKTSVLESLRFALGAQVPESKQDDVQKHLQNILGTGGEVSVLVKRTDGAMLLIQRTFGTDHFRVTFDNDRIEQFTSADSLHFSSYILGWHEIEQAATDSKIRKIYLDTIAGRESIRKFSEEADITAKRIRSLHEQTAAKYAQFKSIHDQIVRLEELRRGLQELDDSKLIELQHRYEGALRHQEVLKSTLDSLVKISEETGARASGLKVSLEADRLKGASPISGFIEQLAALLVPLEAGVEHFSEQHRRNLDELSATMVGWQPSIDTSLDNFFKQYKTELDALPNDKRRLLETHQTVMEHTQELPRLQLQLDQERHELESALIQLQKLSSHVAEILDAKTELRKEKVAKMNEQLEPFHVRLAVEPLAQQQSLHTLRQGHAQGAQIYDDLSNRIQGETRYHRRLARGYEDLRSNLVSGYSLFFVASEFYFFLEIFEEDDLKVSFKVGKEGEEYSPIDQLSAGQRCTAIFPLLLKLQEGPLIVDQPEDNLDNRHIATTIAPALSRDKRLRQVAFTSHNANLVVLTDAEHIVSFEGFGSEGRVEDRGFLATSRSTITQQVLDILDGGAKALELRQRKYGSSFKL